MKVAGFFDRRRQDSFYALRSWRNHPGFALTAMLTLALGIGVNTAIFTVVNAVLLQPLGYQDPDRLVRVAGGATAARFEMIRSSAKSFTGVGAYNTFMENATISGPDGPEAVKAVRVSTNTLAVLGVAPLAGREFTAGEEAPGMAVAMIGESLWKRRFGGDPGIAGQTVRMDGAPCVIAGILPASFQFPVPGTEVWKPWQPAAIPLQSRQNSPMLAVFGRLRPGASVEQANAETELINRRYALAHPGKLDARTDRRELVTPMKEQLVRNVRPMLWMLTGAVGLVLLIACANVAGLLLARARTRLREFAIRTALGASRGRLMSQLLTEAWILTAIGGGLGLGAALWTLQGIAPIPSLDLPRLGEVRVDGTVLGFAVLLSLATAVLCGVLPAWRASGVDFVREMRGGVRGRELLVAGQVGLSIVLLIGAGLLIESLARLRLVDPGFQPANLLTMQLALPAARYETRAKAAAFYEELARRVESLPGVRSAAATLTLPTTGFAGTPVHVVGRPDTPLNKRPIAVLQSVTPGYLRTMGIGLQRGRDLARQDSDDSPLVVLINVTMARRFWPEYPNGEDPVGHSILAGASPDPLQIVGVVADVRQAGLAEEPDPGIYRPRSQTPPMSAMFAVRTDGDPMRMVNAVRAQVMAIDPDQSITHARPMEEVIDESEGRRRSVMILLALFAAMGLLLTVIGIYGVVAYSVTQRLREFGIRKALGAQQSDLLRLVLGQGLRLTVLGAVLGLAGALALTRALEGLLFGVGATDPATYLGTVLLVMGAALAASYVPARRAARVEPAVGLQERHQ